MTPSRFSFLHAFAVVCALSILAGASLLPVRAEAQEAAADEAAVLAMIGSAAPPQRVAALSVRLKVASPPADAADVPPVNLFAVLRNVGTAGAPRYEASGLSLDLIPDSVPTIRIEKARVALLPAADGRSCRFELSGSPFGQTTILEVTGTVTWASGPAGGDGLELEFRLDGAPVEAVRAWLPERMDPSFRGTIRATGKAAGVVGERTTEDAPATPLRGDVEASIDWQILGRTAPLTIRSQWSLDDRMVRLRDGRMEWQGQALDLRGWFDPAKDGKMDLTASFANVDTLRIATDWAVPEAWRPKSSLSGAFTLKGHPGRGLLNFEAKAPAIEVPALGGYTVRVDEAGLKGALLAINADVSVSLVSGTLRVGDFDLGSMPVGVRWWRDKLTVSNSNTNLWEGSNDAGLAYLPAEHPAFTFAGRVSNAKAPAMAAGLVPWLALDVDGASSASYSVGQDSSRQPIWSARASLVTGRLGGADLFARTLEVLAGADPALASAEAAGLLPKPRSGTGTRVDKLFFQLEKKGDDFEVGGLYLRGGKFQLDGDGRFSRGAGLQLQGTMTIPAEAADKLQASAPWIAPLRAGGADLHVGVVVSGPPSSPVLTLAPAFADLLARAKRGEAVSATGVYEARQVGDPNLATIPADPSAIQP
ncbi:MAG: hypothetical protein ABR538_15290 [Candidatus Binatia bacterium]